MKADAKLDLDALLRRWPAPARDEAAWDERADGIVRAALAAKPRGEDAVALLDAPSLAAERGEPVSLPMRGSAPGSHDAPRKRESLREIAERASQAGRGSSPPISSAAPSPISTPEPRLAASVTSTPSASSVASPAASKDSGRVDDLEAVQAGAPEQVAASKPSAPSLREGASPVASVSARRLAAPPPSKRGGMVAGIAVAVLGLAAAAFIVVRGDAHHPPVPTADVKAIEAPPPPSLPPPATPAPAPVAAGSASPPGVAEAPKAEAPPPAAPGVGVGALPAPNRVDGSKTASADPRAAAAPTSSSAPAPPDQPADLESAMAKAAGSDGNKPGSSAAPEPAAGGTKSSAVPDQPPQGSVTSALGSVMGSAKACVAGADDVSRAQVTFSSGGTVANVSVTGWAARNGAGDCVKSALKGANVGPFSKPSFTVGVTIRP